MSNIISLQFFDSLIALAYFSLPCQMIYILNKNKILNEFILTAQIKHKLIIWLFILFIVLCGSTHFFNIFNIYILILISKILTAIVSLITAGLIWNCRNIIISTGDILELSKRGLTKNLMNQYDFILNGTSDIISVHNNEDLIISCINNSINQFGYTLLDIIGKSWYDYVHEQDIEYFKAKINLILVGNLESCVFEYRFLNFDGLFVNVESGIYASYLNHTLSIILCTRDISFRIKKEILIKQNSIDKYNYLMCITHQFKTPMSSIRMALDLLNQNSNTNNKQLIDSALIDLDFLFLIVEQTLDYGKIQKNIDLTPNLSEISISSLVNKCEYIMKNYQRNIPIYYENNAKDINIYTDFKWILQTLINYLTNAVKFTTTGYIKFITNCDLDNVYFKVIDTGIGTDDMQKNYIFDAFKQDKHYQKEGIGIGLFNVKKKIDKLGGTCGVSDNPDGGSIFWLTIPIKLNNLIKNNSSVTNVTKKNSIMLNDNDLVSIETIDSFNIISNTYNVYNNLNTVLVVDDSEMIVKLTVKMLMQINLKSISAINGLDCLDKLNLYNDIIKFILMDIQMPVKNGFDAIKSIKKNNKFLSIPIIAISANNDIEIVEKCKNYGFNCFISKPINFNKIKIITEYLARNDNEYILSNFIEIH
jgi:PAS domain S-box-containing protein